MEEYRVLQLDAKDPSKARMVGRLREVHET